MSEINPPGKIMEIDLQNFAKSKEAFINYKDSDIDLVMFHMLKLERMWNAHLKEIAKLHAPEVYKEAMESFKIGTIKARAHFLR